MKYLIFPTVAAARVRSEAAYSAPPGALTSALWDWREHPSDGRAALLIPEAPEDAGIGMGQEAYDALLTGEERADLVNDLPAGW